MQTEFVPVAIDQFAQRQQRDAEGDFWRRIAGQGPRKDFDDTTQGFYIATADGKLLGFNNNRGAGPIGNLMREALESLAKEDETSKASKLSVENSDPRFPDHPPEGTTVVRVHAKVLGGYPSTDNRWEQIFHHAVSRDNLWITAPERKELVAGRFPDSLTQRLARYHLVDNTRGEPTFWREDEIREASFTLGPDGQITGRVSLARADQSSGYEAVLSGWLTHEKGALTRFDLVARGDYWGAGRYTRRPPEGKFPLGVSFRLADPASPYARVRPQGAKSWWQRYLGER